MLGCGSVASPAGTPGLAAWNGTQTRHWSQACWIGPTGTWGVALALLHVLHTGDGSCVHWSHLGSSEWQPHAQEHQQDLVALGCIQTN